MPNVYARLANGAYLQFPEGTDPKVVDQAVQAESSKAQSPASEVPYLTRLAGAFQSLPVGASDLLANTQVGAGQGQTAEQIKAAYNPNMDDWRQNAAAAYEGGGIPKYLGMAMGSLPIMAEYAITSQAGRGLLGGLAALLTKNPRAIALAGAAGGLAAPTVGTLPSGSGEFKHAAAQLGGIDPDLMDKYGKVYGAGSAALFSAPGTSVVDGTMQGLSGSFTGSSKMAALGKFVATEAAHAGVSGGAMAGMSKWFNHTLDQAVTEQNARNRERGLPPLDTANVEQFKQDTFKSLVEGGTLTFIMRSPTSVARSASDLVQAHRAEGKPLERAIHAIENHIPLTENYKELIDQHIASNYETRKYRESLNIAPDAAAKADKLLTFVRELKLNADNEPARNIAIAKSLNMDTTGLNPHDLVQQIQNRMGVSPKEGPQLDAKGVVTLLPVLVDKPQPFQARMGDELHGALQNLFPEGSHLNAAQAFAEQFRAKPNELMEMMTRMKAGTLAPEAKTAADFFVANHAEILEQLKNPALDPVTRLRREAMGQTELGSKVAEALIVPGVKESKVRDLTTQHQYQQYLTNLEGKTRTEIREFGHNKAMAEGVINAALSDSSLLRGLPLDEQRKITITPNMLPENTVHLSWLVDKFLPMHPMLMSVAEKLKLPELNEWYYAQMRGHALMQNIQDMVGTYFDHHYRALPKELLKSKVKDRFDELVDWISQSHTQRKVLDLELGVKDASPAVYAQRVLDAGLKMPLSALLGHAETIVKAKDNVYQWWLAQGMIPPDKARTKYSPIFKLYTRDMQQGKERVRLDAWLWKMRESDIVKHTLGEWNNQDKMPEEYADLVNLAHTFKRRVLAEDKFVTGKRPASPEFERSLPDMEKLINLAEMADLADQSFIRQASHITDPRQQVALYTQRMARRYAFGPLVYDSEALLRRIETNPLIPREDKDMLYRQVHSMMEQMAGIPDTTTVMLRDRAKWPVNLAGYYELGQKYLPEISKHPLIQKFLGDPKHTDASKLLNHIMNGIYVMGIGAPANMSMPARNLITQVPMTVAMFGSVSHAKGLISLFRDPSIIKELLPMHLRPARYYLDPLEAGHQGRMDKVTQMSMYAFSMGDLLGVWGAGSTAILRWRALEQVAKQVGGMNKLTPEQVTNTLVARGRMSRLPSAIEAIGKDGSPGSKKFWNGVTDPNIMKVVIGKLKGGDAQGAKDIFVRYAADTSNFVYGAGGANQHWRGPAMRFLLAFQSWVPNQLAWVGKTGVRGLSEAARGKGGLLMQRYMQTLMWQYGLAFAYLGMGGDKKIMRNMSMYGVFPNQMPAGGPVGQLLFNVGKMGTDIAAAQNADVLGEDDTTLDQQVARDWDQVRNFVRTPSYQW